MLRNDGEIYGLSPYGLLWNQDYYYVVGWSEKHNNVSVFRVDRMVGVSVTDEKAVKRPEGFKLDDYSKPIFDMFEGTEKTEVRLQVRNDLAKYIVDRFGGKLKTEIVNEDWFEVEVEVSLSPPFFAWVFQFAGGIKIVSPKDAVDEMKRMIDSVMKH